MAGKRDSVGALAGFHGITSRWFARTLGEPTPVQSAAWPAIAAGNHTLVAAPTGTGKTLAAFLVFIDRLKAEARAGTLAPALRLIYVSPLKSLAADIRVNLRRPLWGIHEEEEREGGRAAGAPFDIQVAVRTGDTPAGERRKMLKHPPHILITTPESLFLMLTSGPGAAMLRTARAVVIDELHALIDSKRGAHLMLSLARLDALSPAPLQRIGLSATLRPLADAAAYLSPGPVVVAAPRIEKKIDIRVESPATATARSGALPGGASVWEDIAGAVYAHCQGARAAIAFVDGRLFAEKLAYYVNQLAGEGFALTHHGSLSKERRLAAEEALREGRLRLLCATSSMELGIDIGELDAVLQVGCPLSVSSTLQRLGRAGHHPGRVSVMRIFPKTVSDGLYAGMTASLAREGAIEGVRPPSGCLDVLAQHLVSLSAASGADGYDVDDVMALLARAWPFRGVGRGEVEGVLRMLAGDYEHDRDIPARPRLLYDRINGRVAGDVYSRLLATSAAGTIPDRGLYAVRNEQGVRLGELDEEFVAEQRVGHKFLLGTFAWQIVRIDRDAVTVRAARADGAIPPFFKGDWNGRGLAAGRAFGAIFRRLAAARERGGPAELDRALRELGMDDGAAAGAAGLLERQIEATGLLADDRTVVVENFPDEDLAPRTMLHASFGRRVNAPLALLLQLALRRREGMEVAAYEDDYGILLCPYEGGGVPAGLLRRLDPATARTTLEAALPATPLFGLTFRRNAQRALMMGVRRRGRQPLWVQRLRGAEMLGYVLRHDDHPLVRETLRECLTDAWDLDGVESILRDVRSGKIKVREVDTETPSPLSLSLRRRMEVAEVYNYAPAPVAAGRAAEAALERIEGITPAPNELARAAVRAGHPENESQLHSLLMIEGDLIAGELDLPGDWFESLARQGRVRYIEPGLWIAAEHADEYEAAIVHADDKARQHILRRALRYRGAQSAETVAERYVWDVATARALLEELQKQNVTINDNEIYYHADIYDRARRATVMARRRAVATLPPERYAALLAGRVRVSAPSAEQLAAALLSLRGRIFPAGWWEGALLPARVSGYKPSMLDELLSRGSWFWRLSSAGLSFHRPEEIDWDAAPPVPPAPDGDGEGEGGLSENEEIIYDSLRKRGASFAQGLTGSLNGESPHDALLSLMERGLVRADSFVPIRQWLDRGRLDGVPLRRRIRARVLTLTAGRWEVARPPAPQDDEAALDRAFDQSVILCRETAPGNWDADAPPWSRLLEILRVWEFTGRARRGYFIAGLSGAQFIREGDFAATTAALAEESAADGKIVWLAAVDSAQPWGKSLAHTEERAFLNVPGTAVALRAGTPVAVFERRGQVLRVFDFSEFTEILRIFIDNYGRRLVFPSINRIVVKQYPAAAVDALLNAGFSREMRDLTLFR